jgi:hypothetical protein
MRDRRLLEVCLSSRGFPRACNELFHKRVERHETGECSVCTGHCETPWHVLSECADIEAVAARGRWVRRMRKVLEAAGERVGRRKG